VGKNMKNEKRLDNIIEGIRLSEPHIIKCEVHPSQTGIKTPNNVVTGEI
jgi:hypothetical protein